MVYSRDQWDAGGEIAAKIVEEVFTRFAGIWEVVAGGQTIRTTMEHPFFVVGKGWTVAHELQANDKLLCADGTTVSVDSITDTGEWEVVYNLRVADYHTYFVGGEDWGTIWAHNLNVDCTEVKMEVKTITGLTGPFANAPGRAAKIAQLMTEYANDPINTPSSNPVQMKKRAEAFRLINSLQGVTAPKAAEIFWNILLKIGPNHPQAEAYNLVDTENWKRQTLIQRALWTESNLASPDERIRIVLRPNSTYTLPNRFPTTYHTDAEGRLSKVQFSLDPNHNGSPDAPRTDLQGYMGKLGRRGGLDDGGHMVASRFGGLGHFPNLAPQSKATNNAANYPARGGWEQMEAIWGQALVKGKSVEDIEVTLSYGADKLRPISFTIKFAIVFATGPEEYTLNFANDDLPLSPQQFMDLHNLMAAVLTRP